MQGKSTKSEYIGFRAQPEQQRRLRVLAIAMGSSQSAALRWLVDNAPQPTAEEVQAGSAGSRQPERAPVAA